MIIGRFLFQKGDRNMSTGFIIALVILALAVHITIVIAMNQAMEDKGYGRGRVRAIGLVLCAVCGFCGCVYVAALPDLVSREAGRRILKSLEKRP